MKKILILLALLTIGCAGTHRGLSPEAVRQFELRIEEIQRSAMSPAEAAILARMEEIARRSQEAIKP